MEIKIPQITMHMIDEFKEIRATSYNIELSLEFFRYSAALAFDCQTEYGSA
jgi:hypothetical protein